ncbi:hypothetical protein GQ54DRAFT_298450 [Martensiomyces pterosporus]|nr:hypothetical protein GQ54DRAFT_298450 [Martensiomyces pterosporus]
MSAPAVLKLSGTGAGTGTAAATDIDKETGRTEAGGYPLISDWSDPGYIGHGVGHRDPKTGEPIPATEHIETDGEKNPQNYLQVLAVEENPTEVRQRVRDAFLQKYNAKKANQYRANYYQALGKIQNKVGSKTAAAANLERAELEHAAYVVDHSEIHFRK